MPSATPIGKDLPNLTQGQTLDGIDYLIKVQWNMRSGWYLGLSDANDSPIFQPVKMAVGTDLLERARYDIRCPPGLLMAVDLTELGLEAGYYDLVAGSEESNMDGRVALVYYSSDELERVVVQP